MKSFSFLLHILFIAILFFVLTPGILLTLPKGGSKIKVALVHALIFAVLFHFTYKCIGGLCTSLERFGNPQNACVNHVNTDQNNVDTNLVCDGPSSKGTCTVNGTGDAAYCG